MSPCWVILELRPFFYSSQIWKEITLSLLPSSIWKLIPLFFLCSVRSRESEVKYLSNLVDALLPILLPRAAKENQCVNALLREILVMKCLLPAIDALADPDILNYIGTWWRWCEEEHSLLLFSLSLLNLPVLLWSPAIVILDKDPPPVFTGEPSQKTTIMSNYAQPRRQQPCITSLRLV